MLQNEMDNFNYTNPFFGVVTPFTDNFLVNNVRFYNFNTLGQSAIGSCTHCFHEHESEGGARTVTFAKLRFTQVSQRVRYSSPNKPIYYDVDGTLTGLGAKTWVTPYYKHNDWPECQYNEAVYNGLICDSNV